MGLGSALTFTLAEALEAAVEARKLRVAGIAAQVSEGGQEGRRGQSGHFPTRG